MLDLTAWSERYSGSDWKARLVAEQDAPAIAAIMEYGATIDMPNGTTIVIPPRPFLHPTMEEYRKQVVENYRRVIGNATS